jgi:hypothetical protein
MQVDDALAQFSIDEGDIYTPDPHDAKKFIQQNDTTFQDGVQWALLLAILWTMWTAYSSLDGF